MSKALLKDVCSKIGSGSTPRGGKEAYKEEGISIIRSQNVLDFSFSINGLAYIDEDQAEKLKNVIIEKDDVLLNITGDSVARVCSVPYWALPARVNQHVAIIRANQEKLLPAFLKYHLLSPRSKKELLNLSSSGATRNALTKSMIEDFEINLPPLQEQKRIAHILGTLDDKIELNRKMNQTLESMAQALFQSWFVDFDPVLDNALAAGNPIPEPLQKKAEKRNQAEASTKLINTNPALAKLFPSTFVFNETLNKWIPEGWEVKKVKELGKVVTGKTPSSKTPEHWGEKSLFVTPTDFKNYFKLVTNSTRKISQIGINKNLTRILSKNSVLVTCIGSDMGKVVINKTPCLTNQQINSIIPNFNITSTEFIYHSFISNYERLRTLAFGGSTMPILNKTDFEEIKLLHPPKVILDQAGNLFKSNDNKILKNLLQVENLVNQRDTLLPNLISGKIKTNEI